MRVSPALIAVSLLALTAAGCIDTQNAADGEVPEEPVDVGGHPLLHGHVIPQADGNRTHDWLVSFIGAHSPRLTGTTQEAAAAAFIVSELEGLGYSVEVLGFSLGTSQVPATQHENAPLKAIVAHIEGTNASDRWLAWGGHYDSAVGTIEGAYDNGSGTAVSLELARIMAELETNRTRAMILFNGEEEGLLASRAYAQWYEANAPYALDLFIGFDMVGIAYPAPDRPLSVFMGAEFADPLFDMAVTMAKEVLGLPHESGKVHVRSENTRNSDEASFAAIGVPTLRFAGLDRAADYWGYHRTNDTMETIYTMSGPSLEEGQANFAAGLANTVEYAAGMLLALDRIDPLGEL